MLEYADRGRIMSNRLRLHDEALMLRGARLLAEAVSAGVRTPKDRELAMMELDCCLRDRQSLFNLVFLANSGMLKVEWEYITVKGKKKPIQRIKRIYCDGGRPMEQILPGYNELIDGGKKND